LEYCIIIRSRNSQVCKAISGLEQLFCEDRLGELGLFSWREKAAGRSHCGLPVLGGSLQTGGGRLCTWSDSDRTRGNGFKVKQEIFTLNVRKKFFYSEGDEALEQVSQRDCGCSMSGGTQGQGGSGPGQPDLEEGSPAHSRRLELYDLQGPL